MIILRDMEGKEAEEICELLAITPENQRVLLHRARARIRKAVDALVGDATPAAVAAPARRAGARSSGLARLGQALARLSVGLLGIGRPAASQPA